MGNKTVPLQCIVKPPPKLLNNLTNDHTLPAIRSLWLVLLVSIAFHVTICSLIVLHKFTEIMNIYELQKPILLSHTTSPVIMV